jgi:hypothetical protein
MRRFVCVITAHLPLTYVEDNKVPLWKEGQRFFILSERETASRVANERQLVQANSCNRRIDK